MNHLNKKFMKKDTVQRLLAFASLILLIIIFSLASKNFLQFNNITGILLATSVNGILAVGITFIVITGGIDLSCGTVMTVSAVIAGVAMTGLNVPIPIGILIAIGVGALCGFLNGAAISRLRIPPFIATLGMMMVTKGLALIISGSKPVYLDEIAGFGNIAMSPIFGIPSAVFVFAAFALVAYFILNYTVLGRYNFAIGSNEDATRLSGVNTAFWKNVIYILGGAFAGVAGIVLASRLNSAQPAIGSGYEMEAVAAAVIGGTSLSGGEGSIPGTVIGAFIISVLTNGLRILSVPQEWQTVITGLIVIGAVYMDIVRRRKK